MSLGLRHRHNDKLQGKCLESILAKGGPLQGFTQVGLGHRTRSCCEVYPEGFELTRSGNCDARNRPAGSAAQKKVSAPADESINLDHTTD